MGTKDELSRRKRGNYVNTILMYEKSLKGFLEVQETEGNGMYYNQSPQEPKTDE